MGNSYSRETEQPGNGHPLDITTDRRSEQLVTATLSEDRQVDLVFYSVYTTAGLPRPELGRLYTVRDLALETSLYRNSALEFGPVSWRMLETGWLAPEPLRNHP